MGSGVAGKDVVRVHRHRVVYLFQQWDVVVGVAVEAASIQGLVVLL